MQDESTNHRKIRHMSVSDDLHGAAGSGVMVRMTPESDSPELNPHSSSSQVSNYMPLGFIFLICKRIVKDTSVGLDLSIARFQNRHTRVCSFCVS